DETFSFHWLQIHTSVKASGCECVCVCVCVCLSDRVECVCVCVCVSEREREEIFLSFETQGMKTHQAAQHGPKTSVVTHTHRHTHTHLRFLIYLVLAQN